MITHSHGLLTVSARPAPSPSHEAERERLRRELLQRIVDRESRRKSFRGLFR